MRHHLNSHVIQEYNNDHLIPRRKYLHYLKNNRHISSCLYKYILYFLSKKSKFIYNEIENTNKNSNKNNNKNKNTNKNTHKYTNDLFNINLLLRSNKQIYIFLQEAYKKENIEQLGRFQSLMHHFISFPLLKLINQHFITTHKNKQIKAFTDEQFIHFIQEHTNKKEYRKSKNDIDNIKAHLCSDQEMLIQLITRQLKLILKKRKNIQISNMSYLDIGCGNAYKTKKFAKDMGISKNKVYGTNIETWGPYQKNKSSLGIHFEYIKNNTLPYEDESFDFISSIFNLHHVEKLPDFLKEISRILKKGGLFLLIEHDVYSDYDILIINIQHLLYSSLYDKKQNFLNHPDYVYLYNQYEWSYLLKQVNLQHVYSAPILINNLYMPRYDNRFFGFYQKI